LEWRSEGVRSFTTKDTKDTKEFKNKAITVFAGACATARIPDEGSVRQDTEPTQATATKIGERKSDYETFSFVSFVSFVVKMLLAS
jgi:hypothetical protein